MLYGGDKPWQVANYWGFIPRKYTSSDEMKAEEYRFWQSRPAHERWTATEELSLLAYVLEHKELPPELPRAQMPWVRLPNPWRAKS
jgi:hypothetical protein